MVPMARVNAPNGSTRIPAGQANVLAGLKNTPKLHSPLLLSNKTLPAPQQASLLRIHGSNMPVVPSPPSYHPTPYLGSTLFKYPVTQCLHHSLRGLPNSFTPPSTSPPNHHQQLLTNLRSILRIQITCPPFGVNNKSSRVVHAKERVQLTTFTKKF